MLPMVIKIGIDDFKDLGACIGLNKEVSVLAHLAFEGAYE